MGEMKVIGINLCFFMAFRAEIPPKRSDNNVVKEKFIVRMTIDMVEEGVVSCFRSLVIRGLRDN